MIRTSFQLIISKFSSDKSCFSPCCERTSIALDTVRVNCYKKLITARIFVWFYFSPMLPIISLAAYNYNALSPFLSLKFLSAYFENTLLKFHYILFITLKKKNCFSFNFWTWQRLSLKDRQSYSTFSLFSDFSEI